MIFGGCMPRFRDQSAGKFASICRLSVVAVVAAIIGACEAPQSTVAGLGAPPEIHRFVTGQAAGTLGPDGRFTLAAPSAPGDRPIISAERAGELALASVRTWGPSLRQAWEREAGRSIDLSTLRVDSRILFARTPYGRFPDGYHPAFARTYGPYYLVTLYSGSDPVLLISVAAYNEEARIDEKGLVRRPVQSGAEFFSMGVPVATGEFQITSPEAAVEEVGRATGARVTATPELVRLGMPYAPAVAVWKLTLDRDVAVHAGGNRTRHRVRELYVGPVRSRRVMMALPGNARTERTAAIAIVPEDRIDAVEVPILAGETVDFVPVDFLRGGIDQ
jgi:hypothetical protein